METTGAAPRPLKEQHELLIQIQSIDRRLQKMDRLRAELTAKVDASKAQVAQAQAAQAELKKGFDGQAKSKAALELEVRAKDETASKYRDQLNRLKNNEEYQAMMHQINTLNEEKKAIEDRIVALLEGEEAARKKFEEDAQALQARTAEAEAEQKKMLDEVAAFDAEGSGERSRRDELITKLTPAVAERYQRLFKNAKGMPVSKVNQGRCEGCSVSVPQHIMNETRKMRELQYCQNCGRLLVWEEPAVS
jgi:predicted  nucleic acid-binding Zn-ribbon protein